MSKEQAIYRIQFVNNGKNYQLYVKNVHASNLFGFIEISEFIFDNHTTLLVDPSEEKLKTEFSGVTSSFIPLHAIIRIDAVTEKGTARISDFDGNVMAFPYLSGKTPK